MATISAVDVGAATRKGWGWKGLGILIRSLTLAVRGATAHRRSSRVAPTYGNYVPALGDTTAPRDLQEAADYYLTPRGQHPNAPNRMLLASVSYLVAFTGFDQISTLLTQPLLVVAGSESGIAVAQRGAARQGSLDRQGAVHHPGCHAHGPL